MVIEEKGFYMTTSDVAKKCLTHFFGRRDKEKFHYLADIVRPRGVATAMEVYLVLDDKEEGRYIVRELEGKELERASKFCEKDAFSGASFSRPRFMNNKQSNER